MDVINGEVIGNSVDAMEFRRWNPTLIFPHWKRLSYFNEGSFNHMGNCMLNMFKDIALVELAPLSFVEIPDVEVVSPDVVKFYSIKMASR